MRLLSRIGVSLITLYFKQQILKLKGSLEKFKYVNLEKKNMTTTVYKKFKPNLIPNSKVTDPIDLKSILGDNVYNYIISYKKDGCRMEFVDGNILTRALKPITSLWIKDKFQKLADKGKEIGIILEGEFFSPELRFNEIIRYFKTEDVGSESSIKKLLKLEESGKLASEWPGRSVQFLSSYPESLKLYPFDLLIIGQEDIPYFSRMEWLFSAVYDEDGILNEFKDLIEFGPWFNLGTKPLIVSYEQLEQEYEKALELGYEGLVIANKDRTYKFNRSTAKDNHIFKMKEDKLQYDGVVLDIIEGTIAKEDAPKTTNELGRSVTSKLKEDREKSGLASGILSEFEGHPIKVSLEGFTHDDLRELLANKEEYIGQWFRYTGMAPVARVPRHAHASKSNMWRDDK